MLYNRTSGNEGEISRLCTNMVTTTTWGYWALEMWLVRLRKCISNFIWFYFILIKTELATCGYQLLTLDNSDLGFILTTTLSGLPASPGHPGSPYEVYVISSDKHTTTSFLFSQRFLSDYTDISTSLTGHFISIFWAKKHVILYGITVSLSSKPLPNFY